jgi:predicted RNA binding protein YcfA (HicA-like mRNA interferase family)
MNSKQIIRELEKAGWEHIRTTGSHHHFKHRGSSNIVTVPHPKKDLPVGTVKSIEKQSGLKLRT